MSLTSETQEIVKISEQLGFTGWEHTKGGHIALTHPNGQKVIIPATGSDWRGKKNAIAKMEQVSGQKLPKHNHRKSRKNVKMAGYIETYTPETQRAWSERIASLIEEHKTLVLEFKILGVHPISNSDINRAMKVIRRLSEIEDVLTELRYPIEKFVPK